MLFNSLEYVLFLLVVFVGFWAAVRARVLRTLLLLVASYVFYMSWNATFIFLIVGSTVLDFWVGLALERVRSQNRRRALLGLSLLGNLGSLALFKYFDFFARAVHAGLERLQWGENLEPVQLELILPVGISFYTFQTLSYTIDIYRGRLRATRNFLDFATFVSFFPQLVAGPIVRARELLPQFDEPPSLSVQRAGDAAFLILRGLVKKILIADFLAANWIDRVFDDPGSYGTAEVWFACFAYCWQLYADFSGYTDIARGSAKLFGFELPENFLRPFKATGPIDFWNRWHITLSSWIRDYIYIPLGGSRHGKARGYLNLFVAFLLAGIWHGAGWTFVLFGLWHGITVALNRAVRDAFFKGWKATGWARSALVLFNIVLFTFHWPTFRSPTLSNMLEVYGRMFAMDFQAMRVGPWVWLVTLGITVVHLSPEAWTERARTTFAELPVAAQAVCLVAVSALMVWVGSAQAAPFIYFQF